MESDPDTGRGRICTRAIPRHIGRNAHANSNGYSDRNGNSNTYCDTECNTQPEPDGNCNRNGDANTNSNGNCNRDGNTKANPNPENDLYTEAPSDAGPSSFPYEYLDFGCKAIGQPNNIVTNGVL